MRRHPSPPLPMRPGGVGGDERRKNQPAGCVFAQSAACHVVCVFFTKATPASAISRLPKFAALTLEREARSQEAAGVSPLRRVDRLMCSNKSRRRVSCGKD